MINYSKNTFTRTQVAELLWRLKEPRRFIQVLSGTRQVGKTTLVLQVAERGKLPYHFVSADQPTLLGVPESTLRAFETKAEISLRQFIMLCHVYGDLIAFEHLFPEEVPQTMEQLLATERKPKRQRGKS